MAFTEFYQGKRERVIWVEETSYGSGGVLSNAVIPGHDCMIVSPDWRKGYQETLTAGADDLWIQGRVKGVLTVPYVLSFTPTDWRWLKYLFSVVDSGGPVYTHTFSQRFTVLSWKLEWARRHTTPMVHVIDGNFCKSATIRWNAATGGPREGKISVSMTCIGQTAPAVTSSVTSGISNLTSNPFLFRNVLITIDGDEYNENKEGEITINLGINEQDSRYASTNFDDLQGEPIPGITRVSGRYKIMLKDEALFTLWQGGIAVPGDCKLLFDRDQTGNDQCEFTFTNFYILNAIGPTNFDSNGTPVDIIWSADQVAPVAKDAISTY